VDFTRPICDLMEFGLEQCYVNKLERDLGYRTIADLQNLTERKLLSLNGSGEIAVQRIREALRRFVNNEPVEESEIRDIEKRVAKERQAALDKLAGGKPNRNTTPRTLMGIRVTSIRTARGR